MRNNERLKKRDLSTMNNPNNRMRMAVRQLTMGGRCGFNRRKTNNRSLAYDWWLPIFRSSFRREPQDPWRGWGARGPWTQGFGVRDQGPGVGVMLVV
jgi:hypothetical protein